METRQLPFSLCLKRHRLSQKLLASILDGIAVSTQLFVSPTSVILLARLDDQSRYTRISKSLRIEERCSTHTMCVHESIIYATTLFAPICKLSAASTQTQQVEHFKHPMKNSTFLSITKRCVTLVPQKLFLFRFLC